MSLEGFTILDKHACWLVNESCATFFNQWEGEPQLPEALVLPRFLRVNIRSYCFISILLTAEGIGQCRYLVELKARNQEHWWVYIHWMRRPIQRRAVILFIFADINECSLLGVRCTQLCNNTEGGFHCKCFAGFKLEADGFSCAGITP